MRGPDLKGQSLINDLLAPFPGHCRTLLGGKERLLVGRRHGTRAQTCDHNEKNFAELTVSCWRRSVYQVLSNVYMLMPFTLLGTYTLASTQLRSPP
jgi:hypothetical protein